MSNPSRIWLIRHGETEWSLSGQHSGRYDLPLTPNGEDEARAAALALAGRSFDLVLCSPLQRAKRTCELAGYLDVAKMEPDIMEWDYGECTGFTQEQIRERIPGWTIWNGPVPGGESPDEIAARARRVIASLPANGAEVALFSHGHFLRIFASQFLEMAPQAGRHLALETAAICILGFDGEFPAVRAWNLRTPQ